MDMCEVCTAVHALTDSYNEELAGQQFPAVKPTISTRDVTIINSFINNLNHRVCNCCFQELKQYARLNNVVQGLLQTYIEQVKQLPNRNWESDTPVEGLWRLDELERMLHLTVKVFQPQFPPYLAYKHVLQRPDPGTPPSGDPPPAFTAYCDVNDSEVSEFILRNVCYFCEHGAVQVVTTAFAGQSPATLPLVLAHGLLASVSNLKVWLNYRTIVQLLVPLRAAILKYMCKFSDGDLKSAASRSMSDFMWSSIKDPLDAPLTFDKDGLDLAFKFFTSSTLTMRLAGISQINNHINVFNELCNGESIVEAENVGLQLANWLINNQTVEQLFGPNLHVEIVKQSHVVLSFLAVEGRLTNEHIELILLSAQLKHCSKQVYDILAPLIKNLEAEPVLHLYSLLQKMEPKEHTEQSLYLASVLIKFIWSNGGTYSSVLDNVMKSLAGGEVSSSENSISMDASDDETELATAGGAVNEAPPDVELEDPGGTGAPSQQHTGPGTPTAADATADGERQPKEPAREDLSRKRLIRRPSNAHLSGRESSDGSSTPEGEADPAAGERTARDPAARAAGAGVKRPRRGDPSPPRHGAAGPQPGAAEPAAPGSPAPAPGLVLGSSRPPPSPSLSSQDSQLELDAFSQDKLKTSLLKTELQQFKIQQISRDMSDDEDSCSSRMSVKSEKNMADFDGEECVYEDELVQLAIQAQSQLPHHLANMASMYHARFGAVPPTLLSKQRRPPPAAGSHLFARYSAESVCQPGNTLLWDLLTDQNIGELGEGMAAECEKILSNLLCYNSDRAIRKKFIEGCLQNLAQGRSVLVSLRMLPKLFASFQQFRGLDTHQITLWAEREHSMMQHFFANLRQWAAREEDASGAGSAPKEPGTSRQTEVQVRLHFLSTVFCSLGSPEHFRLSVEQVDTLWTCLAHDRQHSDDLFSWMLCQVRGKDQHALGMDSLRYLLTEKLPSLDPAQIGMTALNLYQQLYQLLRLAGAALADTEAVGMDQLWKIALRANNTDVSLAAIQYLNSCYVSGREGRERQFVHRCMSELGAAGEDLGGEDESSLLRIQRGLVLLKSHLQTYKKRYAYYVRCWHLEGHSVVSHAQLVGEMSSPLRVVLQPAGSAEKKVVTLAHNCYVADLRAEVHAYWQSVRHRLGPAGDGLPVPADLNQLRIISQGTELTPDYDEKLLSDVGFKDMQLVFISVGVLRPHRHPSGPGGDGVPQRDSSPMMLLLEEAYFHQLLQLMHQLSALRTQAGAPHMKAQVLSRRVWDILMVLPTSPQLREGFCDLSSLSPVRLQRLLDPHLPQKLMYSLYLVASLCNSRPTPDEPQPDTSHKQEWKQQFIERGGLQHLYDIFMSGVLQLREADHWDEWRQDCLACLLQLLIQISVVGPDTGGGGGGGSGVAASGPPAPAGCGAVTPLLPSPDQNKKKAKRQRKWDKFVVMRLSPAVLSLMQLEAVCERLTSVLYDASLPRDPNHYKTGFWGRAQVVHYAMSLLVSLCFSAPEAADALYRCGRYPEWLRRLLLEDPEPELRREAGAGLDRLCLGHADGGRTGEQFVAPILSELLKFVPTAANMRPSSMELMSGGVDEPGKEPYGPSSREYFGLTCRLLETVDEAAAAELQLSRLAEQCAAAVRDREILERRHQTAPDDGLVGLLKLTTALSRQAAAFKTSQAAAELVHQLFDALFSLPTPKERLFPKCKSIQARSACYDLLVELAGGCETNFDTLLERLLGQTRPSRQSPYGWDYWPHEDGRSDCGYVGLTNLGATCYMASCMQHLYMMPQARASILQAAIDSKNQHGMTLKELQRMFAYLMESERKAYNPRSFCKVYTMDHRPLNTGEQKDMAEFFIDLVSKLEEMTPELKQLVKQLFCGQLTNNVVSLDCSHVSRTCEEFYTVRCQVADMRNLYESLDEVTVKDTLDGDNMYTCSQCQKKVRAEKRACFKRLPHILCFNTMRYTFNMNTMMREKVNTLFSFPLHLDMSGYLEKNLMPTQCEQGDAEVTESAQYDLIGVTVHTGTADGGHYYCFIRDRTALNRNSWLFFNDAEVKPFDPSQLAGECFGGEMTSKTYDSITDKFLDFSFEKTNSAYMLFYERCVVPPEQSGSKEAVAADVSDLSRPHLRPVDLPTFELSSELEDWIWHDNMEFLRDKSMFDHTFFNFMWQVCGYIPQTLGRAETVTPRAARLSTSFFLEIFIHAKEKPTMVQWVELLTKQFNQSQAACEWFLDHMASDDWWPIQILIKCPNQMVRQMFQRICIHVVQKLRPLHSLLYLQPSPDGDHQLGQGSCVTRFVQKLISLMEHGAKSHLRNLTEYFAFLFEFGKMGDMEIKFLLATECITTMVNFYLSQIPENSEEVSDDEDDEAEAAGPVRPADKFRPASLEKMISLVALLVEKARADGQRLALSASDLAAVAGGKGFPFLYHQIKDGLNARATCTLITALCRWNERLAVLIVNMIFQGVIKHQEQGCQPFFRLLSLLVESDAVAGAPGPPGPSGPAGAGKAAASGAAAAAAAAGLPCFTQLALQHVWEVAELCPQAVLEWLAAQVPRNKLAHSWVLHNMDNWCQHFLLAHAQFRVRASASLLLVGLVPSQQFRHMFTQRQRQTSGEMALPPEACAVLHQIYRCLLRLLKPARSFTDVQLHGNMKLVQYFQLMQYCVVSRQEKLMFTPYTGDLWTLFHPKLSEPSIAAHHNKQALLMFWCSVCIDCPENVAAIVSNPLITKNIGFNYILADHDDDQVVLFNRSTLPAYYGLLRLCCVQSRPFTRQLANHQNLQWAFKNITPYPAQYSAAIDELMKLMSLFVMIHPDTSEQEMREIMAFKRQTLQMYLQVLDARSSWSTLISALKVLVDSQEDRLTVVYNGGVTLLCEAVLALHVMLHEATACHVTGELTDLVRLLADVLRCCKTFRDNKDVRHALLNCKERQEVVRKLATLLNSFAPAELRLACIDALKELVVVLPHESLQVLVPMMLHSHTTLREATAEVLPLGPYFPRPGQPPPPAAGVPGALRPPRPILQMAMPRLQLTPNKHERDDYERALLDYFLPYHVLVDLMCRVAINHDLLTEPLVTLSALLGIEAVPLQLAHFPKLWIDVHQSKAMEKHIGRLLGCSYLPEYMERVLTTARPSLTNSVIYTFFTLFLPKVASERGAAAAVAAQLAPLQERVLADLADLVALSADEAAPPLRLAADVRALALLYHAAPPAAPPALLLAALRQAAPALDLPAAGAAGASSAAGVSSSSTSLSIGGSANGGVTSPSRAGSSTEAAGVDAPAKTDEGEEGTKMEKQGEQTEQTPTVSSNSEGTGADREAPPSVSTEATSSEEGTASCGGSGSGRLALARAVHQLLEQLANGKACERRS